MHHAMPRDPAWVAGYLPSAMMIVGFLVALWFFIWKRRHGGSNWPRPIQVLSTASCSTSGTSTNSTTSSSCAPPSGSAASVLEGGDGLVIDGFGPTACRPASSTSPGAVRLQTGYLYHYAFAMLIGVAASSPGI